MKRYGRCENEYPREGQVVILESDEFLIPEKRNPLTISEVLSKDAVICLSSLTHSFLTIKTSCLLTLDDNDKL